MFRLLSLLLMMFFTTGVFCQLTPKPKCDIMPNNDTTSITIGSHVDGYISFDSLWMDSIIEYDTTSITIPSDDIQLSAIYVDDQWENGWMSIESYDQKYISIIDSLTAVIDSMISMRDFEFHDADLQTADVTISVYIDEKIYEGGTDWSVYLDGTLSPQLPTSNSTNVRFKCHQGDVRIEICGKTEGKNVCLTKYCTVGPDRIVTTSSSFTEVAH